MASAAWRGRRPRGARAPVRPIGHHARVRTLGRTGPDLDPLLPAESLVLLVGPAGSGKSTWAAGRFLPTQVISSDACRSLVADDPTDQSASRDAFRILHAILGARLRRGLLTVVDATNLEARARRPAIALARRWGRPCVAVVFVAPLDELLRRNRGRDRVVPEEVVRRHASMMPTALTALLSEGYLAILEP